MLQSTQHLLAATKETYFRAEHKMFVKLVLADDYEVPQILLII